MTDIVERLRASADHSEKCGWITHARLDREAADKIERLSKIEEAAKIAFEYHMLGYGPDVSDFDVNDMLHLMNKLGEALEPKP